MRWALCIDVPQNSAGDSNQQCCHSSKTKAALRHQTTGEESNLQVRGR